MLRAAAGVRVVGAEVLCIGFWWCLAAPSLGGSGLGSPVTLLTCCTASLMGFGIGGGVVPASAGATPPRHRTNVPADTAVARRASVLDVRGAAWRPMIDPFTCPVIK